MSKITRVVMTSMVVLGLSACSSNPAKVADCVFPNTKELAPDWVCTGSAEGIEVSAVGSAEKSATGLDFTKQMAATSARVQLAQRLKIQVSNKVKQYAGTTGGGDTETVDKVNELVTSQFTNETLVGTRVFKTLQGPDGTMYVLVGLDAASVQKLTESAVKTSMNNDRALWQKFQAGKAQDELAADIAKQNLAVAPQK